MPEIEGSYNNNKGSNPDFPGKKCKNGKTCCGKEDCDCDDRNGSD
ncbi:MAG: hypothetical protein WCX30_00390 [Candidatus Paceibacterota bacterium]